MQNAAAQLTAAIDRAKRILLIPHQHPDGDALGSCLAMYHYLQAIGKTSSVFCRTEVSPRLGFLAGADRVSDDETLWSETPDLVIVFDSGDLRYAGVHDYLAGLTRKPTIIAIDHHITNERYGDINIVDPAASSTAEIVYRLFVAMGIRPTHVMATALLTGLLTDTDNFTNAATTPGALLAGTALMLAGGNRDAIIASVFQNKTMETLTLWGISFSRLQKNETLGLVYTHVSAEDMAHVGAKETDVEGIVNHLNLIGDWRATLLLKGLADGSFKGSFRTTKSDLDVSLVAKHLGGGGHRKAAGFSTPGPVDEALARVFDAATLYFPPEIEYAT